MRALDSWTGRRTLQEEYVEWRVVRDGPRIRRVELTTELGDHWRVLAACDPQRTLQLVSEFARQDTVPVEAVYAGCDPFSPSTSVGEREEAFAAAMLDPDDPSPYNDGRAALCCMVQRTNTLEALVRLLAASTTARVVRDAVTGRLRCSTCDEVLALLGDAAQAGRCSDPVLVERLGRLAYEGRLVALREPVGVFIQSVASSRLRLPDGSPVPPEWFRLSRPLGPRDATEGQPRWQRLTLEPPGDSGVAVDDLVDVATEQRVDHGGQIAELAQVALVLGVSDPDTVETVPVELGDQAVSVADRLGCEDVRRVTSLSPS